MLVAVRAAGINGADLLQVQGFYPAPPGSPQDIPGMEFAGEVIELGPGATRFAVGDRVMAVVGGGAQAELITVHERLLMPVPDGVEWVAAGGFPEVFTTAHDALFTQAQLRTGERVLIHGAAGGVGVAAVQLAHLAGAWVCATVRSERLRPEVTGLGADVVTAPDGFAGPRSLRRHPRAGRRPQPRRQPRGAGHGGPPRGDRRRSRRPRGDRPPRADEQTRLA